VRGTGLIKALATDNSSSGGACAQAGTRENANSNRSSMAFLHRAIEEATRIDQNTNKNN
jgi:hypothetical protein